MDGWILQMDLLCQPQDEGSFQKVWELLEVDAQCSLPESIIGEIIQIELRYFLSKCARIVVARCNKVYFQVQQKLISPQTTQLSTGILLGSACFTRKL